MLFNQAFLKLVEVGHEELGATLLAGLKDGILEQSFVALAALAVLFVLESFHVVFDACFDNQSDIVPEDVGQQCGDDAHVEEEEEEVAAGEGECIRLHVNIFLKTNSLELELDPSTCHIIGLVLTECLLIELDGKEGAKCVLCHRIELLDVRQYVVILAFTEEHTVE